MCTTVKKTLSYVLKGKCESLNSVDMSETKAANAMRPARQARGLVSYSQPGFLAFSEEIKSLQSCQVCPRSKALCRPTWSPGNQVSV